MQSFFDLIGAISGWIWGLPMLLLLIFGGVFLTVRLNFFQFRYMGYIFKQTFGSIFKKHEGEGTVSPFQALTSALACTVGAGNIVGVPAAIAFGGPGAIFWMWVIAFVGMAMKFTEAVLAVEYREKNEVGEYVGGPMYYMTKGLNMKWLGVWFSIALMCEVIPSVMVQSNSVAASAKEAFNIAPAVTGIVALIVVGAVVIGGIKRIGKVTEKLVPFMAIMYVGAAAVILVTNLDQVPEFFSLVFGHAFKPMAAVGGFGGAGLAATIRWGVARGIYSNESGLGTAPIAHATATTDHPVRQGFWAMSGILIDTIIVCTATAFVVISSGVWKSTGAAERASQLPSEAFSVYFGNAGGILVTVALICFVVSTIIVLTYYGEKQAEFLFGLQGAKIMKYVYVAAIFVGAIGGAKVIWQFLDITLAGMAIPNMVAILLLSGKVAELKNDFFTSEDFYLKDIGQVDENIDA